MLQQFSNLTLSYDAGQKEIILSHQISDNINILITNALRKKHKPNTYIEKISEPQFLNNIKNMSDKQQIVANFFENIFKAEYNSIKGIKMITKEDIESVLHYVNHIFGLSTGADLYLNMASTLNKAIEQQTKMSSIVNDSLNNNIFSECVNILLFDEAYKYLDTISQNKLRSKIYNQKMKNK
jgi:hypothetical protein